MEYVSQFVDLCWHVSTTSFWLFVHTKINEEAFPNAINLYNNEMMTGRGKGKYMYKMDLDGLDVETQDTKQKTLF